MVVLTREFTHLPQSHLRSVDEQSTIASSDGGCCGKSLCCVDKSYIYLGSSAEAVQATPSIVGYWISPPSHWWLEDALLYGSYWLNKIFYLFSQQWLQAGFACFFTLEATVEFKKGFQIVIELCRVSDCYKCSNHKGKQWMWGPLGGGKVLSYY